MAMPSAEKGGAVTEASLPPSNSKVRAAGDLIRRASREPWAVTHEDFAEAIETIAAHRQTFRSALLTTNNVLRHHVRQMGLDGQVTQRLKRMQTILDKLAREDRLALERMQDIGGCRVVLPNREDVYRLVEVLEAKPQHARTRDMIKSPRISGYRGVHVILKYGNPTRQIEVQVRTPAMHSWAMLVEEISGLLGQNIKQDGLTPMQQFLKVYADLLEIRELGGEPEMALLDTYEKLRIKAFEGVLTDD